MRAELKRRENSKLKGFAGRCLGGQCECRGRRGKDPQDHRRRAGAEPWIRGTSSVASKSRAGTGRAGILIHRAMMLAALPATGRKAGVLI